MQNSDSHDEAFSAPIAFEISSNASKFAAFSAIRSLVLEHETKYNTIYKLENKLKSLEHQSRSRSEDDGNECKSIDVLPKIDININVPHVSFLVGFFLSFFLLKLSSFLRSFLRASKPCSTSSPRRNISTQPSAPKLYLRSSTFFKVRTIF